MADRMTPHQRAAYDRAKVVPDDTFLQEKDLQGPQSTPRNHLADMVRDYGLYGLSDKLNSPTSGVGMLVDAVGGLGNALFVQPAQSFNRLLSNGYESGNPQSAEDAFNVAGAAMVGGLAAPRPRGSVGMGGRPEGAESFVAQGYHGTNKPHSFERSPWISSDPKVANTYTEARRRQMDPTPVDGSMVYPAEVRFQNPMVYDAKGRLWSDLSSVNDLDADMLAIAAKRKGHDGLVIQNVIDDYRAEGSTPATSYKPLQPGTVYSPLTGELLYANGGKQGAMTGAAVNAAGERSAGSVGPSGRLLEGSGGPTPQQSGLMAGDPPVPVLYRPPHQQGQAPHTTIGDDLLPSASFAPWSVEGYNIAPTEVGPLRQKLQEQFVGGKVPEGWYVHGRARRGDLDTGNVIQGSESPDVATQYAGRKGGSIWALRPAEGAQVVDFTSDQTPDVLRASAKALHDYRNGTLPFADDLTGSMGDQATGRELSKAIREGFAPPNIVNSAGAFDNPNWVNWLYERTGAEFARTPDGGVSLVPENLQAVRLFANGGRPGAAVGAAANAAAERPGIRAYHGSPHDFDKFDMSKIGTGEGAQAYGHGLYFAEEEAVAKAYRDALGNYSDVVKWKGSQPPTAEQQAIINQLSGFDAQRGRAPDLASIRTDLTRARNQIYMSEGMPGRDPERSARDIARLTEQIAVVDGMKDLIEIKPPGRMYEVRINANPDDFLDWDKPLSQQSEKVRGALAQFGIDRPDWSGGQIYESSKLVPGEFADKKLAAQRLRDAGIAGVRYLDQGSRSVGEGSSNLAVFDDNLIEILRKYGLLGMIGGAAVAGGLQSDQNKQTDWARKMQPGDA